MDDFRIGTAILSLTFMTSCGGGGGDSGSGIDAESSPPAQVGVVIDSPIVGLGYYIENIDDSSNLQGFTGRGGIFPFVPGSDITFFIGDIRLPTVAVKKIISPLDLFSTTNVNDPAVINFARLVQTLDTDGDPENGITISSQVNVAATGMSLDFSSGTFDADVRTLLIESGVTGGTLIDAADALAHLNATLSNLAKFAPGESYFEVYGAMDGASLFSTSGHQLLGTSNSGNTFDLTGYNYAIFYIPPQPNKVFIDQMRTVDVDSAPFDEVPAAGGTWDFDVTHPDPDCTFILENRPKCFVETETFSGYMSSSVFFLDEFDGLTWESQVDNPAYWSGPVGGADYWVIKRSLPGEFDVNLNIEDYVEPPVAGTIHISGGPSDLGVSDFKVPETKVRHASDDALTSSIVFYPQGSLPLDLFPGSPFPVGGSVEVHYWPGFPSPANVTWSVIYESEVIMAQVEAFYSIDCAEDDCSGVDYDTVSNVLSFTNVAMSGLDWNQLPSEVVLNGSVKMQHPESVLASLREGFDVFETFNITEEVELDSREWINGEGFTLFCGDIADYSFNDSSEIIGYASQQGQISSFERPWQFDSETFTFLLNDALGARTGTYSSIDGIFTWGPIQTLVDADSVSNTLTMESQQVIGVFFPLTKTFVATLTVSTTVQYNPTGDTIACLYKATLRGAVL